MAAAKKRTSKAVTRPSKADPVEIPVVSFDDARAWMTWLSSHHSTSRGIWLKIAKKSSGRASVTYPEAVEAALSWGWIDGQKGTLDETWWLQRFLPRKPRSLWSKINREKAVALIDAGKMHAPGLAEVERARADGRWDAAYESQSRSTVPADLAAALAASPRAATFFEALGASNRYAVLFRVHTAKKPETRAKQIARLVAMLERHEKLHP